MKQQSLIPGNLRLDGDTQPRVETDWELVADYADGYRAGAAMPPLAVFFDGADYWLADGFHRWHAAREAGLENVLCEVHEGSLQDARWYSYAANQTHGLRRTNSDKRKAVVAALRHPNGASLSDNQLAAHVGVSQPFVGKLRAELAATYNGYKSPSRTGRDGRTIDTSRIGKSRSDVTPVDSSDPCPRGGQHEPDDDGDCKKCLEPMVDDNRDTSQKRRLPPTVEDWISFINERFFVLAVSLRNEPFTKRSIPAARREEFLTICRSARRAVSSLLDRLERRCGADLPDAPRCPICGRAAGEGGQ